MEALVLERKGDITIRDIDVNEPMSTRDVRIAVRSVGVCGSDVHYYTHGAIGPFVVREPMILGHEASGIVIDVGEEVTDLAPGDRVCMEPGIPDPRSKASRLGMYNLDPSVRFWATPPVHGVTRPTVVHPAEFTYKLPDNVSFGAGAMVEPLAVGMHAVNKAGISPGDVAVVIGAGTIGLVTIMAALAGGCSEVIALDMKQPKLDIAAKLGSVRTVNIAEADPHDAVSDITGNWGVDVVFEASGASPAMDSALGLLRPGGTLVAIGMPLEPVPFDVVAAQAKEVRMETIFRYANVYERAVKLLASGAINVDPLVTETYPFAKSVEAYEYAVEPEDTSVKIQIELPS
jgi:D-xylulose reductase